MVHKTKNSVEHVDPSPSFVLGMNDEELKKIECELDPYLPDPMPEFSKELRTDHLEKKAILDKEETPQAAAAKSLEQNEGETEKGARKVENPERIGVEEEVVAEEEKTEMDPDHDTDPDQEGGEGGIVLDKEGGAGGAKPRQGGAGRASAVYNDVIEETASKLLEKRKNKVKALAGAFQTVIDYESSSK
ncbi:uncharacterized protein LOC111454606 [Cucurbita moschata]|uniref:Uncharacterized protein LOC111454606 n=1 Tax=Cucurbita moschata TaxID=3662 RepID=A0A6J1GIV4_CUCMO|nr:uncharacterized protein LOC111454606 [Cucurbita moschata]